MHLKSVLGLQRLLPHLAVAALGVAWVNPSGVRAYVAIAPESIQNTAPSLKDSAIAPKNNSNADDDARDDGQDKKDREG